MKNIILFLLTILLVGCAAKQPGVVKISMDFESVDAVVEDPGIIDAQVVDVEPEKNENGILSELTKPAEKPMKQEEEGVIEKGTLFAKSDFQGVLKTQYVKFHFKSIDKEEVYEFDLIIGDKTQHATFPWDVKIVKPGYFFVEIPVGKYKMTSIAIPVGSTLAIEEVDIELEIRANQTTYAGTLQIIGTKERIKLGGVPVIKPGFEYEINILDEFEEGLDILKSRHPDGAENIHIQLFVHQ